MKHLCTISWILMIIGAINWGLVGVFKLNIVNMLLGDVPILETIVYALVGLAGLYAAYGMITKKGCTK